MSEDFKEPVQPVFEVLAPSIGKLNDKDLRIASHPVMVLVGLVPPNRGAEDDNVAKFASEGAFNEIQNERHFAASSLTTDDRWVKVLGQLD